MNALQKNRWVARIVLAGWLTGWYVKGSFYYAYLLFTAYDFPATYALFPKFFLNPEVSAIPFGAGNFCKFLF